MIMSISFISRTAAVLFVLGAFCFSFQGDAKPKKKKEGKKVESKSKDCDADKLKDMLIFDMVTDNKLRNALVEKRDKKLFKLGLVKECKECAEENEIFNVVVGNLRSKSCTEAVVLFGNSGAGDVTGSVEGIALVGLKGGKLVVNFKTEFYGASKVEAIDVDQDGIDELLIYYYKGPDYLCDCECKPYECDVHISKWKDSEFVELLEYQTNFDNTEERLLCNDDGGIVENPPYKVVKSTPIKYLSSGPGVFNGVLLHVEDCNYGDQDHKKKSGCFKFCKQILIDQKKKKPFVIRMNAGCKKEIAISIPFDVPGLSSGISSIAPEGCAHACALMASGGVKCWGYNQYGQLGDGTTTEKSFPADVSGLSSGVSAIALGCGHTCALLGTGGVKCWGYNKHGQLGDGTTTDRSTPVDVTGLSSGVSAIAAGGDHTCAILAGGGVKCWGKNNSYQVGNGSSKDRYEPVEVSGISSEALVVTAGTAHTCALLSKGGVKCWGSNLNGALGIGFGKSGDIPVDVPGLSSGVLAVAAGDFYTCVLLAKGGVKCWGSNVDGSIGDGSTTSRPTPVDVTGLSTGVSAITAGAWHACALLATGGVKCWGNNGSGQLGDGSLTNRNTPIDVWELSSGISAIAAGSNHACAIMDTGGVKCWGHTKGVALGKKDVSSIIHLDKEYGE